MTSTKGEGPSLRISRDALYADARLLLTDKMAEGAIEAGQQAVAKINKETTTYVDGPTPSTYTERHAMGSLVRYDGGYQGLTVWTNFQDGSIYFYKGEGVNKRVVRIRWPNGGETFWNDEGGKVQHVCAGGSKVFFEGKGGEERKVRVLFPGGGEKFFEGEQGVERRVRAVLPDGQEYFFEGERGKERKVRVRFLDEQEEFFEGENGKERRVRAVLPDGQEYFFEGERD